MLSASDAITLAHLNLAERLREQARWVREGRIFERDDALSVMSSTRYAAGAFNAAMCIGAAPSHPKRFRDQQVELFEQHDRGLTICVRSGRDDALKRVLEEAGCLGGSEPGMIIERPVSGAPTPSGGHIVVLHEPEDMQAFVEVQARAFASMGLPEAVARKVLGEPERMLMPQWTYLLGREGDVARAAAMVLFSHGIAGLYWVGSVPEARGRGWGTAITRAASNLAFERGARAVVLQASRFGEPIYRKLGFREITRYTWYALPSRRARA